jgi:hypothetical protein
MKDNVYTIEEVKERSGHFWDTIKAKNDFNKIGHEIAA